ncbi:MAG: sugar phosphate isomerase/epimerase family protein [Gemmatimonadaceae bacterium]
MTMLDRRQFLAAFVANVVGARSALTVAGIGGAAGCAQGRREDAAPGASGERLERVGLQLYTVRDALARDFEGTLARVAAIGYREVEFAGYAGRRPEAVAAVLERHRLRAPAAHLPLDALRNQWQATVDAAHVIDHDYLIVPWLDEKERRTVADYERIADLFNRLGRAARQADLRFAYHNHDFEFTPIGGRIPFDVLLDRTDPDYVGFEMDLYWITKAGHDPLAYFDRYPGRFPTVHVKDSAGAPAHRMTEVGAGSIDFRRIFARRKQAGIEHAFVEHDQPADAMASIRASYDYLAKLTF